MLEMVLGSLMLLMILALVMVRRLGSMNFQMHHIRSEMERLKTRIEVSDAHHTSFSKELHGVTRMNSSAIANELKEMLSLQGTTLQAEISKLSAAIDDLDRMAKLSMPQDIPYSGSVNEHARNFLTDHALDLMADSLSYSMGPESFPEVPDSAFLDMTLKDLETPKKKTKRRSKSKAKTTKIKVKKGKR